ncbi:MAG: leucine-rich repeat protein [Bacillota bacterium]
MLKEFKVIGSIFLLFIVFGCNDKQEETYMVSFNHDDVDAIEVAQDDTIELPMVISETGFLLGWEDASGILHESTYTVQDDITLEPVFEHFDDVLELRFNDEDNQVTIVSYSGSARHVIVPHTIDGYFVRGLNFEAFSETTPSIVELPMTVYDLGALAFADMPNLEALHFYGEYLGTYEETISGSTFTDYMNDYDACSIPTEPSEPSMEDPWVFDETCPIIKVTEKQGPVDIPSGAEHYSYVAEIQEKYVPKQTINQSIDQGLFYGSDNLETVTLPDKLSHIDSKAFLNLENLRSITIENNDKYYTEDGLLFAKNNNENYLLMQHYTGTEANEWEPERITIDADALIYYPSGLLEETMALPDNIEFISEFAFISEKVKQMTVHDDLLFTANAFAYLTQLEHIEISDDHEVFTDIEGVVYSKELDILYSFPAGKEAKTYDMHKDVKHINSYAFYNQSHLESLTIPEGVIGIGNESFINNTSLKYIDFSSTFSILGYHNLRYYLVELPLQGEKYYEIETIVLRNPNEVVEVFGHIPFHEEAFAIYVPDNLLDAYRDAENWEFAVEYLKPLSELDE